MNLLLIAIYRSIYFLLKSVFLIIKPLLHPKLRAWIQLRKHQNFVINSFGKPIFLFHASSGEIEYVKALIRELKEARAEVFIVVSFSSPSAERLFENIKPYVDLFLPLPWDQSGPVRSFLDQINPHSVFFARTDLWPELLYQLAIKKIDLYVVSYNPSFGLFNRLLIKNFLRKATAIFCIHPQQVEEIKKLLPSKVSVTAPGDTRFDQVFWRLKQPSRFAIPLEESYAVLGSTWPEDENNFLTILNDIISRGYKLIWCPHEVDTENIKRIENILLAKKLRSVKLSEVLSTSEFKFASTDVLIVDCVGYLADLYRHARWAFVGGSFKEKVHSVMEPLCCALPIIVGPRIHNSPEALQYSHVQMNSLQVVQITTNAAEILAAIENIQKTQSQDFKRLLIGHLEQHRNATKKILHNVLRKTQESLNS